MLFVFHYYKPSGWLILGAKWRRWSYYWLQLIVTIQVRSCTWDTQTNFAYDDAIPAQHSKDQFSRKRSGSLVDLYCFEQNPQHIKAKPGNARQNGQVVSFPLQLPTTISPHFPPSLRIHNFPKLRHTMRKNAIPESRFPIRLQEHFGCISPPSYPI